MKLGGGRVRREQIEHPLAVLHAAAGGDVHPEHALAPAVVREGMELERPLLVRLADAPAGEAPGHLADVVLGVSAVDAERVQLEQLAGVVLVEPQLPALRGSEALAGRGPVVEVEEHRRVVGHRAEQVAEGAEEVGADRVALVGRDQPPHRPLVRRDVEVVEPEVDQRLLELAPALGGADEPRGDELGAHLARQLEGVHHADQLEPELLDALSRQLDALRLGDLLRPRVAPRGAPRCSSRARGSRPAADPPPRRRSPRAAAARRSTRAAPICCTSPEVAGDGPYARRSST